MPEPSRPWFHGGESLAARREEIDHLRRAIGDAEARSGERAPIPTGSEQRLRSLIAERNTRLAAVLYRIEHSRREIESLEKEASALLDEIGGYEKGLRALLGRVLEDADRWAAPLWSPVPVLGYRMWVRRNVN